MNVGGHGGGRASSSTGKVVLFVILSSTLHDTSKEGREGCVSGVDWTESLERKMFSCIPVRWMRFNTYG